jgi:hypothetical protein
MTEFFENWPIIRSNWWIIWSNRLNFGFLKFFCSFHGSTSFRPNFSIFTEFLKIWRIRHLPNFKEPSNFETLRPARCRLLIGPRASWSCTTSRATWRRALGLAPFFGLGPHYDAPLAGKRRPPSASWRGFTDEPINSWPWSERGAQAQAGAEEAITTGVVAGFWLIIVEVGWHWEVMDFHNLN